MSKQWQDEQAQLIMQSSLTIIVFKYLFYNVCKLQEFLKRNRYHLTTVGLHCAFTYQFLGFRHQQSYKTTDATGTPIYLQAFIGIKLLHDKGNFVWETRRFLCSKVSGRMEVKLTTRWLFYVFSGLDSFSGTLLAWKNAIAEFTVHAIPQRTDLAVFQKSLLTTYRV